MEEVWKIVRSRTTMGHAISGSMASCAAMSFTYPLEKVRIYILSFPEDKSNTFEILFKIIQQDGLSGLFSGLQPMLVALGTSNLVFFYWHSLLKALVKHFKGSHPNVLQSLVVAFVAGCINVFMTSPLWVSFVRMMGNQRNSKYLNKNIFQVMTQVVRDEGVLGLWSGLAPSLLLVSNPAIQFVAFERLKSALVAFKVPTDVDDIHELSELEDVDSDLAVEFIEQTRLEMTSAEAFVLGGVSKLIATVLTYPLQVAQTEMRASGGNKTTLSCLRDIYQTKGVLNGLFKGFFAKLLQTVLNSAAMFLVYEKLSTVIFSFLVKRKRLHGVV